MADDPYAAAIISAPAANTPAPAAAPPADPYAAAVKATGPAPVDPYAAATVGSPAGPGAITPPGAGGYFGANPVNAAQRAAVKATTDFGNFMYQGHKDPVGAFLGKLQGGQRFLQTIGTQAFGDYDPTLDPIKAMMNPATAPATQAASDKWMGIGPGGPITNALGGTTPNGPQRFAQGAVHSVADAATSPFSYVAPGPIAKGIADVIPGATPALAAAGKAIGNGPVGAMFNPDYYLRGLTPEGKAQYEAITNKAMETVRNQKAVEDAAVKAAAPQIRAGQMPPEIAALFTPASGQAQDTAWKTAVPDLLDASGNLKVGTNPADIQMALYNNRAPVFKSLAMPELKKAGFFTSPSGVAAGRSMGTPDLFDVPSEGLGNAPAQVTNGVAPHPLIELQKRLEDNLTPKAPSSNPVAQLFAKGTQLGNQAFLANPVPHVGNLADLLYNRYGLPALGQGIVNGARVATGTVGNGKLADQIARLEATGTKSQYGNIFNELGFTGLPNSSATTPLANAYNATVAPASRVVARAVNVPLIAGQRASNAAQNAILNPAETGFRAAALGAEDAAGTDQLQAMKNIHGTFGTNAPSGLVSGLQKAAVPFAGFHYATAPASVASAAFNNPGRIVNTIQTERDMNNALGTKYRSTIPGANAARMAADPLGYFGSPGGMFGLEGPYSILTNAKNKGSGLVKAVGGVASKFVPGSEPGIDAAKVGASAFNQMLNNGPQTNYTPLFNAAFGGYNAK